MDVHMKRLSEGIDNVVVCDTEQVFFEEVRER